MYLSHAKSSLNSPMTIPDFIVKREESKIDPSTGFSGFKLYGKVPTLPSLLESLQFIIMKDTKCMTKMNDSSLPPNVIRMFRPGSPADPAGHQRYLKRAGERRRAIRRRPDPHNLQGAGERERPERRQHNRRR